MSSQSRIMSKKSIEDFLFEVREKNKQLAITGILLLIQGKFVQYIEGPAEEIDRVYESINQDKRHTDLILLDSGELDERQFKDWSMAYKEVGDKQIKEIVGKEDLNLEEVFLKGKDIKNHPVLTVLYDFVKTLSS
ncbi:BLUF domain-containing protein [Psychroflexus sp. CAK57W]|uniref:BLUF domain-containing protein n=1 Tax=Psychroflexus curvus TaxID=2873595 RepID=UPI001CCBBA6E|nr:BLUF domain-containing protein [Psychroflexus curvus]MBZ9628071.1 BLUF domain-containing protein [Psychroflexus curvus]MBZ9787770.1 BLUF domain-containing protein [Psychroflexus curvus]